VAWTHQRNKHTEPDHTNAEKKRSAFLTIYSCYASMRMHASAIQLRTRSVAGLLMSFAGTIISAMHKGCIRCRAQERTFRKFGLWMGIRASSFSWYVPLVTCAPRRAARLRLASPGRAAAPARQRTWHAEASGGRTFHDILSASILISPAEKPRGTSRNVAAMAASTNSTCEASSLLSAQCVCKSAAKHTAAATAGIGLVSSEGAHHAQVQAYSPLRLEPCVCGPRSRSV